MTGLSATGEADHGKVIALPNPTADPASDHERTRRRAVVYIRESTEEQGKGYSPDGQRGAIAQFADATRLRLVGEYLDLESGTKADTRKDFQRLIADAMTGAFDVVLVFHTSRFARNAMEAKQYKKLLREELGIDVISVTQSIGTDTNDPTAFLNESINEVFDEYYSRSLSFWTKMGLAQKARQGLVTGSLPWGYLRGDDGIATPDPERAPVVLALFTIYATGNHSYRDLANWLNARGFRTTRGSLFCSDTVRDMIGNLSYAGFVTAQRSTSREIKGKHEPIITEELFDRCAELRRQRTTTKNPGRPSQRFVLKSIARCERCQGRMYGQNTGRKGMPRYYCSTRRKREGCDQPLAPAVPIEQQLAEFVAAFTPSPELRDEIMARLAIKEPADADTRPPAPHPERAPQAAPRPLRDGRHRAGPSTEPNAPRSTTRSTAWLPDQPPTSTAPAPCWRTSAASGRPKPTPSSAASWSANSSSASGSTTPASSPYGPRPRSRRSSSSARPTAPQTTTPPLVGAARLKIRERRDSNPRPPA